MWVIALFSHPDLALFVISGLWSTHFYGVFRGDSSSIVRVRVGAIRLDRPPSLYSAAGRSLLNVLMAEQYIEAAKLTCRQARR
jgi:hypothetical protein